MIPAFFLGIIVGFSLILAIGAQNAFVFRNGLVRNRIGLIVLFCALADALLIALGVSGAPALLNDFVFQHGKWLFYLAALWLFFYGVLRIKSALFGDVHHYAFPQAVSGGHPLFIQLAIFTFLNPHVYLDTLVLIGAISVQFTGIDKIAFAFGAICASFLFFFSLGYGATYASRFVQNPKYLRNLDIGIAVLMFGLAINFFYEGSNLHTH